MPTLSLAKEHIQLATFPSVFLPHSPVGVSGKSKLKHTEAEAVLLALGAQEL